MTTGAAGRSLPVFVLGLWLGMLVASWVAATVNFRTVDRVLGPDVRPELREKLAPLPADDHRMVLRHLASEINRWLFRWFGPAQIVLAALVLAVAWPLPGAWRYFALAAAALAAIQILALTPQILELGRSVDFLPRPLAPEVARRFGVLHAAYVVADLVKALLLAVSAWLLVRRG